MYSKVIDYVKGHMEKSVDARQIQSGYFGDFLEVNLARPAVLLEPRSDKRSAKSTRWKDGRYNLKVWVLVEIDRDYLSSMRALEQLLDPDDETKTGVISALNKLKTDDTFRALTGKSGGKIWRIAAQVIEINDTDFTIQQTASQRINVAMLDVDIIFETEK